MRLRKRGRLFELLVVTLLCELPAALSSVTAAHRGPLLLKQAMSLRGGEDSQSFPAVGSEEGVEKLKAVMSAACDPTQTAEQQAASKASILDMVSERWGQLPKDKQADLKRFALQQLSSAAGVSSSRGREADQEPDAWDVSMKVAMAVSAKLVPQWGGLLGRIQNLVSDIAGGNSSQTKAERMVREAMELAWTRAAGATVRIRDFKLPQGDDKDVSIMGFQICNPGGSMDFDPTEVAVSIESMTVEPAVDILNVLGGDLIIVEKVSISGIECHLQMANFSNFFKAGRPMSNLQVIHEHLTLFHEGGGHEGKSNKGGNPLAGLLNSIGGALKLPKSTQDARIVVRRVEVTGVTFTCGATFMDGRFKIRIPDAIVSDVGNEARGGVHPTRMGEAIWGAVMRDLLSKVNVFKFAQTHHLGAEISASVGSLLQDLKGGADAVKSRLSCALKAAADAIKEEMFQEAQNRDPQKEARDRFYEGDDENNWSEDEERRKKLHEEYDPVYPPEADEENVNEMKDGSNLMKQILLDFEKGLKLNKVAKGDADGQ